MRKTLLNLTLAFLIATVSLPAMVAAQDTEVGSILDSAAETINETESMAFVMKLEGTTYVDADENIQLIGAEGVMQRPDRADVIFTAEFMGMQQISIRMITIGEDSWITDIVTGQWVPSPPEFGYNPSVLYDDEHGLGPVMSRMNDPEVAGSEEIDGKDAWHIVATVDGEVTELMTAGTMRGSVQSLELWIDKETNDILQIRISEPEDEDLEDPATWTLILTDHNEEVNIEQPGD